jgi:cytochrome c peroxidase
MARLMTGPRAQALRAALLAVLAATAARPALAAAGEAQAGSGAKHGATAFDVQQQALDGLLKGIDPLASPPGIDQTIWLSSIPKGNELNAARIALGRKLYFDPRLSSDDTVACATCHDVARGFTDQRLVSEGVKDRLGRRNAPTTLNAAMLEPLFLDGRAATLEDQAGMPILNPIEMGMKSEQDVVTKLAAIPEYKEAFRNAYGRDVSYEDLRRAIASFERTLVFLDSPFDRFLRGDQKAISDSAHRGWDLFNGKARCVTCHQISSANPIGTDFLFHNIGVSARKQDFEALARKALQALAQDSSEKALDQLALGTDLSELGRFMITREYADIGSFRTLQLRNLGITAPYMHDGSLQTLWDVMDHYNKGGEPNPYLDGGIEPLALTEEELGQVVDFMFTLTDDRFADQNRAQMEKQRAQAAKSRPFRDDAVALRQTISFKLTVPAASGATGGGR